MFPFLNIVLCELTSKFDFITQYLKSAFHGRSAWLINIYFCWESRGCDKVSHMQIIFPCKVHCYEEDVSFLEGKGYCLIQ